MFIIQYILHRIYIFVLYPAKILTIVDISKDDGLYSYE